MPDGGGLPELLAPARWVKQELFFTITGFSVKAQRHKMDDGVWPEWTPQNPSGVWKKAPDGNRLLHLDNYYRWVEGQ
ncbi:MAG: hypothetical protein ACXWF2_10155 [Usitatibacter sp.]